MKTTAGDLVSLLKELGEKQITIRVDRPENYKTDPRNPTLVMNGIGAIAVHGGNHVHVVLTLSLELLSSVDPKTVLESPDLDLDLIRRHRSKA